MPERRASGNRAEIENVHHCRVWEGFSSMHKFKVWIELPVAAESEARPLMKRKDEPIRVPV